MLTQKEYDVLSQFRQGPVTLPSGPTPMISHLVSMGFLRVVETDYVGDFTLLDTAWELTQLGHSALDAADEASAAHQKQRAEDRRAEAKRLEERHEDHAREERYQRTQNRVSIAAAAISSLISFLCGIIIEHITGILSVLRAVFG